MYDCGVSYTEFYFVHWILPWGVFYLFTLTQRAMDRGKVLDNACFEDWNYGINIDAASEDIMNVWPYFGQYMLAPI